MKKSLVLLTFLCLFSSYTIDVLGMKQREQKRSSLIKLIESDSTKPKDEKNLKKNLHDFLNEYPVYLENNVPFCQNMTLDQFLIFHKKDNYVVGANSSTSEQLPINFINHTVIPAPVPFVPGVPVVPIVIPTKKQTLSSHGCQKTILACAFTCHHN